LTDEVKAKLDESRRETIGEYAAPDGAFENPAARATKISAPAHRLA